MIGGRGTKKNEMEKEGEKQKNNQFLRVRVGVSMLIKYKIKYFVILSILLNSLKLFILSHV